ncbi:hypothetical protein P8452_77043 [Trifolium repens]|nr:hypothetical protein P8452_77043 [Trifolium repens]
MLIWLHDTFIPSFSSQTLSLVTNCTKSLTPILCFYETPKSISTNKLGLEFKQLCSPKPTFSWRFRQW